MLTIIATATISLVIGLGIGYLKAQQVIRECNERLEILSKIMSRRYGRRGSRAEDAIKTLCNDPKLMETLIERIQSDEVVE